MRRKKDRRAASTRKDDGPTTSVEGLNTVPPVVPPALCTECGFFGYRAGSEQPIKPCPAHLTEDAACSKAEYTALLDLEKLARRRFNSIATIELARILKRINAARNA